MPELGYLKNEGRVMRIVNWFGRRTMGRIIIYKNLIKFVLECICVVDLINIKREIKFSRKKGLKHYTDLSHKNKEREIL